jgi:hypothetical protein
MRRDLMAAVRCLSLHAVALAFCVGAAGACAADVDKTPAPPLPITTEARVVLRSAQPEAAVAFRGALNFDKAGGPEGQMMYPAPGVLGLFAAVLTHGAIVESSKTAQKTKLQEEADKVLLPYREALDGFKGGELLQRGAQRLGAGGSRWHLQVGVDALADWVVEIAPVFSLTQDQGAVVLDNAVAIYSVATPTLRYANVIKVVSAATLSDTPEALWGADQAKMLRATSASLLALSLDVALDEAVRTPAQAGPQRTVRYAEGKVERMERAELLSEQCNRVLMRTLRGWVMSVPSTKAAAADAPSCEDPPRVIE